MFGVMYMTRKQKREFIQWHNVEKTKYSMTSTYNLKKELIRYCALDVQILHDGCENFRKHFIENCKLDPFLEAVTLSSACNKTYRKNDLTIDTLITVSPRGLQQNTKTSYPANIWLKWIMQQEDITIQCALNGKEKQIGYYRLDGYIKLYRKINLDPYIKAKAEKPAIFDAGDELCLEFLGCLTHGCEHVTVKTSHTL